MAINVKINLLVNIIRLLWTYIILLVKILEFPVRVFRFNDLYALLCSTTSAQYLFYLLTDFYNWATVFLSYHAMFVLLFFARSYFYPVLCLVDLIQTMFPVWGLVWKHVETCRINNKV
jgi:hypothetical protein